MTVRISVSTVLIAIIATLTVGSVALAQQAPATTGKLSTGEVQALLNTDAPASRKGLLPPVAAHAAYLTTTLGEIDAPHQVAAEQLAQWVAENYRAGEPLHVTVVCTGNSRRSILGATMGNIAAAYYGMPEVRFHSGGTAPSAFNPRTVTALKAVGVEIEPTGKEAPRAEPATPNPVYQMRWGKAGDAAFAATEFSNRYDDATNPSKNFAACVVSNDADVAKLKASGASLCLPMPYPDPKAFDGTAEEAQKYAERRDDEGRMMLSVMKQARQRIAAKSSKP